MSDRYDVLEEHAIQSTGGVSMPGRSVRDLAAGSNKAQLLGAVTVAQSQLKSHGFDPGGPSATFNASTRTAITGFQKAKGLPATGTLDPSTQAALASPPSTAGRSVGSRRLHGGAILVSTPSEAAASRHAAPSSPGAALPPAPPASPGVPPPPTPLASFTPRSGAMAPPAPPAPRSGAMKQAHPGSGRTRAQSTQSNAPQPAPHRTERSMSYQSAGKRVPVVFASNGTVAVGAAADLIVTPQIPFRGENLVVDAATAAFFSIRQLKIGVTPQTGGGSGDIPATCFTPGQQGALDFEMDLCDAGTQMILTVVNTDTAVHAFVGTVWGHEIKSTPTA